MTEKEANVLLEKCKDKLIRNKEIKEKMLKVSRICGNDKANQFLNNLAIKTLLEECEE